jgi:Flp pilus assembly protein TadG
MDFAAGLIRKRLRGQKRRGQSGVTAAEMALIAPAFFLLLIGIVEFSLMMAAQQLLDNATFNASRVGSTGYAATGQSQTQTVTQILDNELASFGALINVNQVTLTSVSYNDFANIGTGGTSGMGTPDQIVVYTVSYPWKFFTPLVGQILGTWNAQMNAWVLTLTSQIVVRNEPYGS